MLRVKIKNPAALAGRRETEEDWACHDGAAGTARRNMSPAGKREGDAVSRRLMWKVKCWRQPCRSSDAKMVERPSHLRALVQSVEKENGEP
jgi:hypothetical protein